VVVFSVLKEGKGGVTESMDNSKISLRISPTIILIYSITFICYKTQLSLPILMQTLTSLENTCHFLAKLLQKQRKIIISIYHNEEMIPVKTPTVAIPTVMYTPPLQLGPDDIPIGVKSVSV